jgi:hypothetical protein
MDRPLWLKFGSAFALVGFAIAEVLCAYGYYLTSHRRIGNEIVFLTLCPPSIGAIALDNAGLVGGILGWQLIAAENALIYFACGALVAAVINNWPRGRGQIG